MKLKSGPGHYAAADFRLPRRQVRLDTILRLRWLAVIGQSTAVLVVAVIVMVILLIFVIPQFESLFKGFGADLPAFTQMVVNLSRFVQHQGWWMLMVAGGGIYAFFYFKKRSRNMRRFHVAICGTT